MRKYRRAQVCTIPAQSREGVSEETLYVCTPLHIVEYVCPFCGKLESVGYSTCGTGDNQYSMFKGKISLSGEFTTECGVRVSLKDNVIQEVE